MKSHAMCFISLIYVYCIEIMYLQKGMTRLQVYEAITHMKGYVMQYRYQSQHLSGNLHQASKNEMAPVACLGGVVIA